MLSKAHAGAPTAEVTRIVSLLLPLARLKQCVHVCECLHPPPTDTHRQFKPRTCTCACVCSCPSLRPQLGKPEGLRHSQRKEQSRPVYLSLIALQLRTDCRGNKGLIVRARPSPRTSYFLWAADPHPPQSLRIHNKAQSQQLKR